jgi:hypothetical protein
MSVQFPFLGNGRSVDLFFVEILINYLLIAPLFPTRTEGFSMIPSPSLGVSATFIRLPEDTEESDRTSAVE